MYTAVTVGRSRRSARAPPHGGLTMRATEWAVNGLAGSSDHPSGLASVKPACGLPQCGRSGPRVSPRVPVSRNARFQLSSSWAGISLSRETASRGLPRSSRSTNSVFRCTLHRSGSSTPPLAPGSSAGTIVGFRAFFPMSASLVTMIIRQISVQRNRVRFSG